MSAIANRFTRRYGCAHPFACAGMAFICETPPLAIATIRGGGVGALAGSLMSPEALGEAIEAVRAAADGPLHVNFLTIFPHDAQIAVCVEKKVPIVSFHWGLPSEAVMAALKAGGASVWAQVGSAKAAAAAVALGCEAVIAQGAEAGGHNYAGPPLMALLPAVRDAAGEALVLAAGGIADGRGAAAALALGADAVWVGTRMVATPEANAHESHRAAIVAARAEDTLLSSVYGPEAPHFNPMRLVRNPTIAAWNHRVEDLPKDRGGLDPIGETRMAGALMPVRPFDAIVPVPETTGDLAQMPMLCGAGAGLISAVDPAEEVVRAMMEEAAAILGRLGASAA